MESRLALTLAHKTFPTFLYCQNRSLFSLGSFGECSEKKMDARLTMLGMSEGRWRVRIGSGDLACYHTTRLSLRRNL